MRGLTRQSVLLLALSVAAAAGLSGRAAAHMRVHSRPLKAHARVQPRAQLAERASRPAGSSPSRRAAIGAAVAFASAGAPLSTVAAADDAAKARSQISAGVAALDDLIGSYDEVVAADGGNGVRRVLGKLGPTSPLHRVDKALNLVARGLEDERAFDLVDQFMGELDAADGDAYSSIFVPTGGGTTPEFWLERSKKEIAKARATLDVILGLQ